MNATATITFVIGTIDNNLDELATRFDGLGFPVEVADLEAGTVTVDASSEPDNHSLERAAEIAAIGVGIDPDDILSAELD